MSLSEPPVRQRTHRVPGGPAGARSPSRAATDRLLAGLREDGWGPAAWGRFLGRAALRSIREAVRHGPALAETTALHAAFALAAPPRGRGWVAASWGLAAAHLGMLEDRRTLGTANILTLVRANLPALGDRIGPLLPVAALATDFLDGRLSRATGTQSPFGRDADFIADAAVWNWYATRYEPSRILRLAAVAVWAGPIAAVGAASFAGAAMKDVPRSPWIRPAAALQVVLGARAILRAHRVKPAPSDQGAPSAPARRRTGGVDPSGPWRVDRWRLFHA